MSAWVLSGRTWSCLLCPTLPVPFPPHGPFYGTRLLLCESVWAAVFIPPLPSQTDVVLGETAKEFRIHVSPRQTKSLGEIQRPPAAANRRRHVSPIHARCARAVLTALGELAAEPVTFFNMRRRPIVHYAEPEPLIAVSATWMHRIPSFTSHY